MQENVMKICPWLNIFLPRSMLLPFGVTFSPWTGVIQYKRNIQDDQNSCRQISIHSNMTFVTTSLTTKVRLQQQF